MIVARCPVRISLAGGSTDLDAFLSQFGAGSVISFTANLYTYIALRADRFGLNGQDNKFVLNYMEREVVAEVNSIKNDVARVCFQHFNAEPLTCWFNSDVYSSGSGLAASSSYLNAFISAMASFKKVKMSQMEICQLSHKLEKIFNPLTGYQDPYGCGIPGFKKLNFYYRKNPTAEILSTDVLKGTSLYLVHTGIARKSTGVLSTIDPQKCLGLLDVVDEMHKAILEKDQLKLLSMVNEGWTIKKSTSKVITQNEKIVSMDSFLSSNPNVLAHRLLGAGNGGYFLFFAKSDYDVSAISEGLNKRVIQIEVDNDGVITENRGSK